MSEATPESAIVASTVPEPRPGLPTRHRAWIDCVRTRLKVSSVSSISSPDTRKSKVGSHWTSGAEG